jgi:protocatechuate 3,4-dioxygenase beta subunit
MNEPANRTRRTLLLGIMALPVTGLANAAIRTPGSSEGPFYPSTGMRFGDTDNDLVKISDQVEQAGGEIVRLKGRVLDRNSDPVESARIEIWQCDVNGRYLHRGDTGGNSRDNTFQGFGHDMTNAEGEFTFRTIKPVPYTSRTPHIHLKVLVAGKEQLTTQLYLSNHPGNDGDWLYRRIPREQRELVVMHFNKSDQEPVAQVDLVI